MTTSLTHPAERPSSPDSDAFSYAARSLATPLSPALDAAGSPKRPPWPRSNSSTGRVPLWSRRGSRAANGAGRYSSLPGGGGARNETPWYLSLIHTGIDTLRAMWSLFQGLPPGQKAALALFLLVINIVFVIAVVYSEAIYHWLGPRISSLQDSPWTGFLLFFFTCASAFPPMIGYSTCVTLAGFIYGMRGWFLAATANVLGSLASFIVCRRYLAQWSQRLAARDARIAAFTLVVQRDGFPLLVAIRLCPLPYALSNCALSTIASIRPIPFAFATAAASLKLLLHVFVGSRLALLASAGVDGAKSMDPGAKAANYLGIAASMIVGGATGWVIYRRTVARARQLEAEGHLADDPADGAANGNGLARPGGKGRPRATGDGAGIALAGGLEHPDAFADGEFDEEAEERDEIDFGREFGDAPRGARRESWGVRRGSGDSESNVGVVDKRRD